MFVTHVRDPDSRAATQTAGHDLQFNLVACGSVRGRVIWPGIPNTLALNPVSGACPLASTCIAMLCLPTEQHGTALICRCPVALLPPPAPTLLCLTSPSPRCPCSPLCLWMRCGRDTCRLLFRGRACLFSQASPSSHSSFQSTLSFEAAVMHHQQGCRQSYSPCPFAFAPPRRGTRAQGDY